MHRRALVRVVPEAGNLRWSVPCRKPTCCARLWLTLATRHRDESRPPPACPSCLLKLADNGLVELFPTRRGWCRLPRRGIQQAADACSAEWKRRSGGGLHGAWEDHAETAWCGPVLAPVLPEPPIAPPWSRVCTASMGFEKTMLRQHGVGCDWPPSRAMSLLR